MKISHHARQRRGASYDIIRREVVDGIEIDEGLARTLLDRADNRRFKDTQDRFILSRDLLGLYILTKKERETAPVWIVVTHIDLSDGFRQNLLRDLFKREKITGMFTNKPISKDLNTNVLLSKAILFNHSLAQIEQIKDRIEIESGRFSTTSWPCSFCIDIKFDGDDKPRTYRVSKNAHYKQTKVSIAS